MSFVLLFSLFVHSFIRLFADSFVSLLVHSFIRLFVYVFVHVFVHSFVRLFVHSFVVCSFSRLFVRLFFVLLWVFFSCSSAWVRSSIHLTKLDHYSSVSENMSQVLTFPRHGRDSAPMMVKFSKPSPPIFLCPVLLPSVWNADFSRF